MTHFWSKIRSTYMICLIGILFMVANLFIFKNEIVGGIGFLLYVIPLSLTLGQKLFAREKIENFLYGFLLLLTELVISGTAIYYVYKITPLLSFLLLLIPLMTCLVLKQKEHIPIDSPTPLAYPISFIIKISLVVLDLFLLHTLYTHRTSDLAASPWLLIDPSFFILYAITTFFLFYNYKHNHSFVHNIILTSLHFFVGISVAAILYPLGYGFDAFIHRVTEQWIQTNGSIFPKQPYYVGQYSLVVLLSNITHIKVFFIDVFLVPVLAATLVPGIVISTLKKWFEPQNNFFFSSFAFWILPFVPFLSLQLTTPHNLVLLFTILLVFLNFSYTKKDISGVLPLLVSLAALITHPLIGAPGFLFTAAIYIMKKFEDRKKLVISILSLLFFTLCFLLPILFTLNGLRIGKSLPALTNPFTHFSIFLELFKRPYWYAQTGPLRFEILYFCERLIVPVVLLFAVWGFVQYKKSEKSLLSWIFPLTTLGLFIDAWLLRSWIIFPDVVAYEQGDYPMRLIYTSIIFLLPFAMYGLYLFLKILSRNIRWQNIFIFLLSIVLTVTLYLSYPQRNNKVRFPGYNVTQSDFKAVEWIHQQNSEYNYIVLSNQLISAAALTDYSFAKYFDTPMGQMFYYSIPTGGELYKYYGKMIYEGQKREYMNQAMNVVGVKKAYFVINSYWANSGKIIEQAKRTADSYEVFDEGKVWVFAYTKK